jgi:hypothetical protein
VACASVDTEKDVGWRLKTKGEKLADGMVAARHFNTVQLQGDYVVKTSARSVLRGEMFFYSHMPPDISDLFPQLKSSSDDPPKPGDRPRAMSSMVLQEDGSFTNGSPGPGSPASRRRAEQIASMTLQRVHGVTFSHLVTNRCLTAGRLVTFLTALHRLHTSVGDPPSQIAKPEIDVCQNYLPKLRRRFEEHRALYLSLMPAVSAPATSSTSTTSTSTSASTTPRCATAACSATSCCKPSASTRCSSRTCRTPPARAAPRRRGDVSRCTTR